MALLLSHPNRALQSVGVLQSPAHHARHHKDPFASHFCAGTNLLNPVLEAIGFWRGLEARGGYRSRASDGDVQGHVRANSKF